VGGVRAARRGECGLAPRRPTAMAARPAPSPRDLHDARLAILLAAEAGEADRVLLGRASTVAAVVALEAAMVGRPPPAVRKLGKARAPWEKGVDREWEALLKKRRRAARKAAELGAPAARVGVDGYVRHDTALWLTLNGIGERGELPGMGAMAGALAAVNGWREMGAP